MSRLRLDERIAAPIERVYGVVADVERYPDFLPDVAGVSVRGDEIAMRLYLGLVPVSLVTQARFSPPGAIDLVQVSGPFRRFQARWTFAAAGPDLTEVSYEAEYELPLWSPLLGGAARALMRSQAARLIQAFRRRLAEPSPPSPSALDPL